MKNSVFEGWGVGYLSSGNTILLVVVYRRPTHLHGWSGFQEFSTESVLTVFTEVLKQCVLPSIMTVYIGTADENNLVLHTTTRILCKV